MRSCLIATALARRLGLPESEVSDTYYTALLTHVGCSALSHETVAAWGNDQRVLAPRRGPTSPIPATSPAP